MLARSDEWWLALSNQVYFWSGVATLLAGTVTIIATRGVQFYSNRIDAAQKNHISELELQTAQANREAKTAIAQSADTQVKIAEANVRTEEAHAKAETAITGQKKLEVEAEQARAQQKGFEAQLGASHVQQEQLRKQNLELQANVEQERLKRLQIEQRLAPRHIDDRQRQQLLSIWARLKGQTIGLNVFGPDYETEIFGKELQAVFSDAGVKAEVSGFTPIGGGVQPGITLRFGANRESAANIIAQAFIAVRISIAPIPAEKSNNADEMTITVGPKPR